MQREDIDNPITKSDLSSYRMKKIIWYSHWTEINK